jgi:hypothetical protein
MKTLKYRLKLEGLDSPAGTISTRALFELLKQFTACTERGLRLAIEGQSNKSGPIPKWLETATDFSFTGIETGSTILAIEAPVLKEVIPEQVVQQDLWGKAPDPQDTAISYIGRSVRDMADENMESNNFDAGVLAGLLELKPFLAGYAKTIRIHCENRKKDDFKIDLPIIEKVEKLKTCIPEPRVFMLSGQLEQIRYNKKGFHLEVAGGQSIPGKINEEFMGIEELRDLWGKKVTIKGVVNFKPSGKMRFLEAQMIKPKEDGEEIFESAPASQTEFEFARQVTIEKNRRDWLKDLMGQWPGDEPIEDLIKELDHK